LVAIPLVYAVIFILRIYFYNVAEYLRSLADLYEAFGLAFLLTLFLHSQSLSLKIAIKYRNIMAKLIHRNFPRYVVLALIGISSNAN
jgi:hypothetical protein